MDKSTQEHDFLHAAIFVRDILGFSQGPTCMGYSNHSVHWLKSSTQVISVSKASWSSIQTVFGNFRVEFRPLFSFLSAEKTWVLDHFLSCKMRTFRILSAKIHSLSIKSLLSVS